MEEIVFNPNERAVSVDHMRLQRFKGADIAELWRSMLNTSFGTDDLDAAGQTVQVTTQNSPISGEVLGGICVLPQTGIFDLLVTPGTLFLLDPDSPQNPDESLYKFVRDPGVPAVGVGLVESANTSGGIRIDVIECSRVSGGFSVLEADNRDIFNVVTGLFTAQTVNKVTAGRLQYRVRQGTPGGGYPGTAQGWLPLCIASVPNGATSNDQITFWDVRPMMADRIHQPFNVTQEMPRWSPTADIVVMPSGGLSICTGHVDVTATDMQASPITYGKRRLGGRLRRGTPGTDIPAAGFDGLDLASASNQDNGGGGVTTGATNYLYLIEPLSLPRWARYTDATTGVRKPRSPRGIPVLSSAQPQHLYGCPIGGVTLPTSTGLSTVGQLKGVCLMALGMFTGTRQPKGGVVSGRRAAIDNAGVSTFNTAIAASINTTGSATFVLVGGTTHPAFARSLDVTLSFGTTLTGGTSTATFTIVRVDLVDPTSGSVLCSLARTVTSSVPNAPGSPSASFTIPCPGQYAQGGASGVSVYSFNVVVDYFSVFSTPPASASLQVNGWEMF